MSNIGSYQGQYSYSSEFGEGIQVLYTYTEVDPLIVGTTVSYAYSDDSTLVDPILGDAPAATQAIMNNLPLWMEMRKDRSSVGQTLVNAWGMNFEKVRKNFIETRNNQFLSSANLERDISAGVTELSFNENKVYEGKFDNLLYNSSFSIEAFKRAQKPEGWNVLRDNLDSLQFDKDHSLFGTHALKLDGTYGPVVAKQTREFKVLGGPLTLSIYVQTEENGLSITDKYDADEAGLVLIVHYADGEVKSYGTGFPYNTSDSFVKAVVEVNLEKELHSFEVLIVNRNTSVHIVDLPMLSVGNDTKTWTPSFFDVPAWERGAISTVAGVQVLRDHQPSDIVKKTEVFGVSSEAIFRGTTIPTRIERYFPTKDAGLKLDMSLGRHVSYYEEELPIMWPALDGKISESSVLTPDVYNSLLPADLYITEDGTAALDMTLVDDSDNVSVKATTVVDDTLYVVTQETYAGKTRYYLKFVSTHKLTFEATYLESLGDLILDMDLDADFGLEAETEDIDSIGVCKNIPHVIFVDTTRNRRLYFKLFFDYYYADFGTRKLFCREQYINKGAHLQVI
jgi:hypothetical protein